MEPHTSEFRSFGPVGPVVDGRELVGLVDGTDDEAVEAFVRAIHRSIEAHHGGPDAADLDFWAPHLSHVAPNLVVTGGFAEDSEAAGRMVERWLDAEVTHILECEGGGGVAPAVREIAPGVEYLEMAAVDDVSHRHAAWWEQGLAFARPAGHGKLLVFCRTGIAVSPSLAFRILLDRGVPFEPAFMAIGAARPIVRMLHAQEAIAHQAKSEGWSAARTRESSRRIAELLEVDPVEMWAAANLAG